MHNGCCLAWGMLHSAHLIEHASKSESLSCWQEVKLGEQQQVWAAWRLHVRQQQCALLSDLYDA